MLGGDVKILFYIVLYLVSIHLIRIFYYITWYLISTFYISIYYIKLCIDILIDVIPVTILKSWEEDFVSLGHMEGVGNVASADHDLSLEGGFIEVNGKEGRHAGGGVVAGATEQDGEGADNFVGGRVKKKGTVI